MGDGTLEAVILLCETESGKIVDLRIGATQLRTMLHALSVYDGYVWLTVRKRDNGHFYLKDERLA